METKVCIDCKKDLPLSSFAKYKSGDKTLFRKYCNRCKKQRYIDSIGHDEFSARMREYVKKHRESEKGIETRKKYLMSEAYEQSKIRSYEKSQKRLQ